MAREASGKVFFSSENKEASMLNIKREVLRNLRMSIVECRLSDRLSGFLAMFYDRHSTLGVFQKPQRRKSWGRRMAVPAVCLLALVALITGCATDGRTADPSGAAATSKEVSDPLAGIFGPAPKRTGIQLWSDNCNRCHNSRPPSDFSGAQWTLLTAHMRQRANLTGDEERKILAFLQAGSGAE